MFHGNFDNDLMAKFQELRKHRVLEYLEPVVPLFVGTASSWEELLDLAQGRGDPA
jgi:hypothetical protein